jgi:deazaflavin-dependent oxidoreductase (nitroreductase family)
MDDAAYVVIGSNAGSEKHPAWFLNIKNNPYVTIKVKNKQLQAIAKITNPEERNKLWIKLLELAPSYKTYQKRTAREIPIVLLRVEDTGT